MSDMDTQSSVALCPAGALECTTWGRPQPKSGLKSALSRHFPSTLVISRRLNGCVKCRLMLTGTRVAVRLLSMASRCLFAAVLVTGMFGSGKQSRLWGFVARPLLLKVAGGLRGPIFVWVATIWAGMKSPARWFTFRRQWHRVPQRASIGENMITLGRTASPFLILISPVAVPLSTVGSCLERLTLPVGAMLLL